MSTKQGNLLWNRRNLTLPPGDTDVDTGLREANSAREAGDPPLDGTLVGSRVQVLPEPPMAGWIDLSIGQPFVDPVTDTVHVVFTNADGAEGATVNVLFLDPHSWIGPGAADQYVSPPPALPPVVQGYSRPSGSPGTAVSVFGLHFAGMTGVTVDGIPVVAPTFVNDGQIDIIIPGGFAADGPICVTTGVGAGCGPDFLFVVATPWVNVNTMITPRTLFAFGLLQDGRVIIAGGQTSAGTLLKSAEIYDPVADTWTALPDMNVKRSGPLFLVLPDGRFLVAGGQDDGVIVQAGKTAEVYDPIGNAWALTSNDMSTARFNNNWNTDSPAALITAGPNNGNVLVSGELFQTGVGPGTVHTNTTSEIYDVGADTWGGAVAMPGAIRSHRVVTLPSGAIIATGGSIDPFGALTPSDAVSKWDPATNTWSSLAVLPVALLGHSVRLLTAGAHANQPFVTGGDSGIGAVATTFFYDSVGDAWSAGPAMADPRVQHVMTRMANGKLIVIGGSAAGYPGVAIGAQNLLMQFFDEVGVAWVDYPSKLNIVTFEGFAPVTVTGVTPAFLALFGGRNQAGADSGQTEIYEGPP